MSSLSINYVAHNAKAWLDSEDDDEKTRCYWQIHKCPIAGCSEKCFKKWMIYSYTSRMSLLYKLKRHLLQSRSHPDVNAGNVDELLRDATEQPDDAGIIASDLLVEHTETFEDRREYRNHVDRKESEGSRRGSESRERSPTHGRSPTQGRSPTHGRSRRRSGRRRVRWEDEEGKGEEEVRARRETEWEEALGWRGRRQRRKEEERERKTYPKRTYIHHDDEWDWWRKGEMEEEEEEREERMREEERVREKWWAWLELARELDREEPLPGSPTPTQQR